jgi:hypothetical protein
MPSNSHPRHYRSRPDGSQALLKVVIQQLGTAPNLARLVATRPAALVAPKRPA